MERLFIKGEPIGVAAPTLGKPVYAPPSFTFTATTVAGQLYRVEFKSALAGATWLEVSTIRGDGTLLQFSAQITTQNGFYRLAAVP